MHVSLTKPAPGGAVAPTAPMPMSPRFDDPGPGRRRGVCTLLGLELRRLFRSPLAFLFAAIFLLLTGYTGMTALLSPREATARYAVNSMAVLFVICIPVLTMRSLSEERSSGRIDYLLASPLSTTRIVLGKYLGAATFASLLVIVAIGVQLLPVLRLGHPDVGEIAGGFLGLELFVAAAVAVSLLWSAVSVSMLVAGLGAIVTLLLLWFVGSTAAVLPGVLDTIVQRAALGPRLEPFTFGLIRTDHIAYFALAVLLPLIGTIAVIGRTRPRWPRRSSGRSSFVRGGLVAVVVMGLAVAIAGPVLRVDLTAGHRLTLSRETRQVLDRLPGRVEFIAFLDPSQPDYRQARNLLRLYSAYSGKVALRFVDLRKDPQTAARYGVQQPGEIILRGGGRQQWASRASEDRLTVALSRLSGGSSGLACMAIPVAPVGLSTGGYTRMRTLLVDAGFDVSDADGTVPGGCDVLIVGPGTKSAAWVASLHKALAAVPPPAVIALAEPGQTGPVTDLLAERGVAVDAGLLRDPDAGAASDPTMLLAQTPEALSARSLTVVLPGAGALRLPAGAVVLAETSPSAVPLAPGGAIAPDVQPGRRAVAAVVTSGARPMAVIGDADFVRDDFLGIGDNADFLLDLTTRVLGRKPILVRSRQAGLASTSLVLSARSTRAALLYTTILVPAAFLLAGLVIMFMRRGS